MVKIPILFYGVLMFLGEEENLTDEDDEDDEEGTHGRGVSMAVK